MTIIQAIILGLIQGITEYLPISSSAHLIIFPELLNWEKHSLAFDVFLNLGTLIAIIIYFKNEIISIIRSLFSQDTISRNVGRQTVRSLIISTLSILPIFLLINRFGESLHEFSIVTVLMLLGFGIPMIFIDYTYRRNKKDYQGLKISEAIFIGVAQSLALISGVSRSGITIMAGLMIGLKKDQAKEYSFLASIPVIAGSFLIEAIDIINNPIPESLPVILIGIIFSFIGGYLAIKTFMAYLNNHSLRIFGIYRIIFAIILYFLFFFK